MTQTGKSRLRGRYRTLGSTIDGQCWSKVTRQNLDSRQSQDRDNIGKINFGFSSGSTLHNRMCEFMKRPEDHNSPIEHSAAGSKHYQLRELLREQISTLNPNDPIPTEFELCERYSLSRTTVRKAIDYLIYEGLLYRIHGKGTFVAPPKFPARYVQRLAGFYDDMTMRGLPVRTQVLQQELIKANADVAYRLELELGQEVLKLSRLRFVDDEPMHIVVSYLPHDRFPGIMTVNFTEEPLYGTLRTKYDVNIHHGKRVIEAQPCTPDEAELLGITEHTPLLVLIGVVYDEKNAPLEYGIVRNRGDRAQIDLDMITL